MTISVEDAEEYTQALGQVVAGGWRQIALGKKLGVPEALGLTVREWVETRLGGYVRLSIEERRQAVLELAEEGHSQREIAEVLGVSRSTVDRDLDPGPNGPALKSVGEFPHVTGADADDPGPNGPGLPTGQERAEAALADIEHQDAELAQADLPHLESDPDPDSAPEPQPLAEVQPGWYELGDHLLYCGSSTDPEFIERCRGAAFAFADPPYNAGKAQWDDGFTWEHDYLAEVADIVAVTPGIAALAGFLADTQMPYKWSLAAEITNGMTAGALRFGNWICVTLFAHGSIYRQAKDHVRIPAATSDDRGGTHPSRKPFRLLTHLIELFTSKGDLVVDPFLGSGTTLIAAERTGRRCIGAEIDTKYCAEIINRYHQTMRSS